MTAGRQPGPEVHALLPLVYDDLRRLAAAYLRRERPGQTIQPTSLVHDAYLRLLKDKPGRWQNRAHFCIAAAPLLRIALALVASLAISNRPPRPPTRSGS